jgi:hypothetical protein
MSGADFDKKVAPAVIPPRPTDPTANHPSPDDFADALSMVKGGHSTVLIANNGITGASPGNAHNAALKRGLGPLKHYLDQLKS